MKSRARFGWLALGLLALGLTCRVMCRHDTDAVTLGTFNIRMFPEATTDRARVALALAELDASVIAVQEIRDPFALFAVAALASEATDRDYAVELANCGSNGLRIGLGFLYDRDELRLVQRREVPALGSSTEACEPAVQPALLGVFERRDGRRFGVVSLHMHPYAGRFEQRKQQWTHLLRWLAATRAELGIPILAMGDYNTTGFLGQPVQERAYVQEIVQQAGFSLPTQHLACTEYWQAHKSTGRIVPSLLDHVVATDGAPDSWSAQSLGMCERLACQAVDAGEIDPDYVHVSDHCPVRVVGSPW